MSDEPEYLICLECETPSYTFEWQNGKAVSAQCLACGNDDVEEFMTEADLEEMSP
jgi:transcription initiation factor IIE alpha subunit